MPLWEKKYPFYTLDSSPVVSYHLRRSWSGRGGLLRNFGEGDDRKEEGKGTPREREGAIHSTKIPTGTKREKWSTPNGGPIFSKLFRLDRTDPLSFGPKFPEILVEWIASRVSSFRSFPFPPARIFQAHPSLIFNMFNQETKETYHTANWSLRQGDEEVNTRINQKIYI